MKGQWLGEYQGSVEGTLMVNIDEVDDSFQVVAYLTPNDKNIPSSVVYVTTKNKLPNQEADAYALPIHPKTGFQCEWEEIKQFYPNWVFHSKNAKVNLELINEKLHINAVTEVDAKISCVLEKPLENGGSKIVGKKLSWQQFKEHVSGMSIKKYLFRGQTEPWRLQTSFHRRGRYRLNEFINNDVQMAHQRLSAITSHYFDLSIPNQNGAFVNLLQHHGYPTPLLDWSYSPYVAAFFAFRDRPVKFSGDGNVRIYIFDNVAWQQQYRQIGYLDRSFPHLSVMNFIAINNPRLVPQQAVTTATNIYDIEAYMLKKETEANFQFLQAIDIPASLRDEVMTELRFMGITAASMFPGIDGVCEELRERNFEK